VPTGIKAGVLICPWGVVITPLRPRAPFKVFSTLKEKDIFNWQLLKLSFKKT
jgi:hypothetical protein